MPFTQHNNRTYYAITQLLIKNNALSGTNEVASFNDRHFSSGCISRRIDEVGQKWEAPRGVQSVTTNTTFNTEQTFQLGQVELYEYSERQPDIEMTMEKILDGTKPLYMMLTDPDTSNDLIAKNNTYRSDILVEIFPDSQFRAKGAPKTAMMGSGLYLSSVTYTFQVDGPVTETCTVIGNDKIWTNYDALISGCSTIPYDDALTFPVSDPANTFDAPGGSPSGQFGHEDDSNKSEQAGLPATLGVIVVGSGVQRREEVDIRRSIIPCEIPGAFDIVSSGVPCSFYNDQAISGETITVAYANTKYLIERIQTITATVDLGREDILELGAKRPFIKFVNYPVEVTCSFDVVTSQGDLVDARSLDKEDNTNPSNTIVIRCCDGFQLDLGDRNKLTGVSTTGGDTGGGNQTITYNYSTFSEWFVTHDRWDPNHRIGVKEIQGSRFNSGGPNLRVPAGFPDPPDNSPVEDRG